MKLRKIILLAVRGCIEIRRELSEKNSVTLTTINNWLNDNDDNLTKVSNIQIIKQGLSKEGLEVEDSEILEESVSQEAQH